jgi:hypothetical protein
MSTGKNEIILSYHKHFKTIMATYFKTPFDKYYVQVTVPKIDKMQNVILCVDKSGSMAGGPNKNVCAVMRDIYQRTQINYDLLCFNTTVTKTTISSVQNGDIKCEGGTSFSCIFTSMKDYLIEKKMSTSFIFLTDGCDTDGDTNKLQNAIQMLKFAITGINQAVTIHVIGFGSVDDAFLNNIRTFGTKDGMFRYATQSTELANSFNDMFDYAASAREFKLVIAGKTYTSNSNNESVGFLINEPLEGTVTASLISDHTSSDSKSSELIDIQQLENVRSIHLLKSINLLTPSNENEVKDVLKYIHAILPTGINISERLEVEQIKSEISNRMMEYINLFTQLNMGYVPEQVKLKLSALKHDAIFSDLNRKKKLDIRVNKNVDYFRNTDISGILEGFKKDIDSETWEEIKNNCQDWMCTYSKDNIYELMRKSPDNIMCVGILVERDEKAIDSPTSGLKLVSMSNTIISYDSFIQAMTLSKSDDYGDFQGVNKQYCIVGSTAEDKINAVIPLYINDEHFKRIRILEGIWLGHLYTLNSMGYDKAQEIGLLKLFYDIISVSDGTQRNLQIIDQIEKVCQFIITESVGFKTAYGEYTYDNFVKSIHGRNSTYDLSIPLIIGYLKGHVETLSHTHKFPGVFDEDTATMHRVLMSVYCQSIRHRIQQTNKIIPSGLKIVLPNIINILVYGLEVKTVSATINTTTLSDETDPDYIEQNYIKYYHDETCKPINIIPEMYVGGVRRDIGDTDKKYICSILVDIHDQSIEKSVPECIHKILAYLEIKPTFLQDNFDYDMLRRELLLMFFYIDTPPPTHVTTENIITVIDESIQGKREEMIQLDLSQKNINIIVHVALNCKTLNGFAGIMRRYCPKRYGVIFDNIVRALEREECSDKLRALLSNRTQYSKVYLDDDVCWQPYWDTDNIRRLVGPDIFDAIEKTNFGKTVYHCYRPSNKANYHGWSNLHPNPNRLFKFISYNQRQ